MDQRKFVAAMLSALMLAAPAAAQRGPQGPTKRDAYLAMQAERFSAMDSNHDGVVTKDEMRAQMAERMGEAPPADRLDAMFATIDGNGDGKASAAEAQAGATARFATLDADHDNILTPDERRAGMGGR